MEVISIRLGKKAQVVIPKKAREAIGLLEGRPATLVVEQGLGILLGDPKNYGRLLRGLGREIWAKAGGGKLYLQRERDKWERKI